MGKSSRLKPSFVVSDVPAVPLSTSDPDNEKPLRGLSKWLKSYYASRPPPEVLQNYVDSSIEEYHARQAKALELRTAIMNEVDEDGFIKVSRGSKRNVARHPATGNGPNESVVARGVSAKVAQKLTVKEKIIPNFYRFQQKKNKLDKLTDLRKNFELDKRRIAKQRESRKFKPF